MVKNIIIEEGLSLRDMTGVGQYTLMLCKALDSLDVHYELKRKKFLECINNRILRRTLYLVWLNTIFLLKQLFMPRGTIIIYTNYALPYIKVKKIRQLPVIHDLIPYFYKETINKSKNINLRQAIRNALRNADSIITVSNTVKKEIIDTFSYNANKIFIVHSSNSTGLNFNIKENDNGILQKYYVDSNKYIMSVSTLNKHKNLNSLIEAFCKISSEYNNIKLVLVGGSGNNEQISHIMQTNKNIIFTNYISDEDLSILYKNAYIYVAPSLYEGFGTPVIDSQRFGIPLICSDIPIFREVAGKGAEFCSPTAETFAEKIQYLLNNTQRRSELVLLEQENYKRFSIEVIKEQIKNVIELIK